MLKCVQKAVIWQVLFISHQHNLVKTRGDHFQQIFENQQDALGIVCIKYQETIEGSGNEGAVRMNGQTRIEIGTSENPLSPILKRIQGVTLLIHNQISTQKQQKKIINNAKIQAIQRQFALYSLSLFEVLSQFNWLREENLFGILAPFIKK
ncbi:UNKNOWN [Stylonychia lemnae]|uniref:Uncharacterized protein n=1 Tax=Stylonychia lemnae TaxID=5949 RepID=A0A077ZZP2_STYLE|nr:UNKNOWN [Stylonychia lemnae]|eukprot:CDW74688.1 UNKNOWN [Stylonychia lemnae]